MTIHIGLNNFLFYILYLPSATGGDKIRSIAKYAMKLVEKKRKKVMMIIFNQLLLQLYNNYFSTSRVYI